MISRQELMRRARGQSQEAGDYWDSVVDMLSRKTGIGIADRGQYSQKEWNFLEQVKAKLVDPWE